MLLWPICRTVELGRLLWVVENFFAYAGCAYHELSLCFLMSFAVHPELVAQSGPFFGAEPGCRLIFQWFDRAAVAQMPLSPTFLRQALQALPATTEHIVHHDGAPPPA